MKSKIAPVKALNAKLPSVSGGSPARNTPTNAGKASNSIPAKESVKATVSKVLGKIKY